MFKCPNCQFIIQDASFIDGRSNPQNRYFHGVVIPVLAEHTGYDNAEMKEILKAKFLSETRPMKTEKGMIAEVFYIKPTSSLNTVEFELFLEKIRVWASRDLGVVVPLPGENNI